VIARVDTDVLAFQEIVGTTELQMVLDLTNGMTARNYRLSDADDHLLGEAKFGSQKVVVTYDAQRDEPVVTLTGSSRQPSPSSLGTLGCPKPLDMSKAGASCRPAGQRVVPRPAPRWCTS
jgi:hypothetical protein